MHLVLRALLLDLDGVLVDSRAAVERHWTAWAARHDLDPALVLAGAHGAPARQTVARLRPDLDAAAEAAWLLDLALADPEPDPALPGAGTVLRQRDVPVAVVTSGERRIARQRLDRAGLPVPDLLVSADDVTRGKPDPEPYLRGAALLGVHPADCVVVEDSPAGLTAARAAGATPLGLLTSHPARDLGAAAALLPDLSWLAVDPAGLSAAWPRLQRYAKAPAALLPWDPRLPDVAAVLARLAPGAEHIGSTSVPGLPGKGVVDLQVVVPAADVEGYADSRVLQGWQRQTIEAGFPRSRPMLQAALTLEGRVWRAHLHVLPEGSTEATDNRLLRDRLHADADLRTSYVAAKTAVLAAGSTESVAYAVAKGGWVQDTLKRLR